MIASCCGRGIVVDVASPHLMSCDEGVSELLLSRDNIWMRRLGKMHGTWIKSVSFLWKHLTLLGSRWVVLAWLCNHDPQLALSARLTGNRKVRVCMTNFLFIFFAVQDLDWGAVANHPPCELAEWNVCTHMHVWPYCTSLIVLHNVKNTVCTEQAIEQEVAQCVLFSMGDSDIHLRLGKA